MRKRQIYWNSHGNLSENEEVEHKEKFIKEFQTAILLSLLEEKQLTKWQFDFCMDELYGEKNNKAG